MNREIKYQVYIDKDVPYVGGKMWGVFGMSWREYVDDGEPENPIREQVMDLDIDEVCSTGGKTAWQGAYIRGKFHLRAFTGLKDKNGKEIYEGDILKTEHGATGIVYWLDGVGYKFDCNEPMWKHPIHEMGGEREVIGNIYENPDLLSTQSVDKK